MKSLKKHIKQVNKAKAQRQAAKAAYQQSKTEYNHAKAHRAIVLEAQALVQTAAKAVQDKVHSRISGVVTKCLAAVFGDTYTFEFVFEKKRGRTEARPAFFKKGHEFDPMGSVGGGIVDVTAFALRVCKVLLQRPPVARILFLDEPFTRPSKIKGYRERVRDMLETVCEELDFQIIMVTHDEELACGHIVKID